MTKPGLSILDRPGFVRFAGKGVRALIRFWGLWLPVQSRSRMGTICPSLVYTATVS
jgi:hypothetical protein